MNAPRISRSLLVLVSAFFLALLMQIVKGETDFVRTLTSEDHLIENLAVVAFLIAIVLAGYAVVAGHYRLVAGLWFVLCIAFVGEETSWFQRAIGYSVPFVEQRNSQAEFNLHNLDIIHGSDKRTFVSPDGSVSFAWQKLLTSQTLFRIGFAVYFFVLPLLMLIPVFRRWLTWLGLPPFDRVMLAVMWGLIALTIPLTLMLAPPLRLPVAECRELIYALTIAFYVAGLAAARRVVSADHSAPANTAGRWRQAYLPAAGSHVGMPDLSPRR
ncbi:MAG: hypothetical protein AAGJ70_08125 [Pseudomonadota bacterium]